VRWPLAEPRLDLFNKKDGATSVAGFLADPSNKVADRALAAALPSPLAERSLRQRRRAHRQVLATVRGELFNRGVVEALTVVLAEELVEANLRLLHRDRARRRPGNIAGSARPGGAMLLRDGRGFRQGGRDERVAAAVGCGDS